VPFALGFQIYPWVERILKVRQRPIAAYGFAILMVALAVLVRGLVGQYVGVQVFTTFYPAIIIAALVGGLWPGVLATVLSAIAAWYLVIPLFFARPGQRELVEFVLFIVISGIDVAIAVLLNKLVDRLVTQQRNIRLLLESAPNGFVLVDEKGTIRLVNVSAEKLFGYSREELVGKAVESLVPERFATEHRKMRAAYQEKPEVRMMGVGRDLSGKRKDGSEFPLEIGLNPVGQGKQPAILATVMDISARKEAEERQRMIIGELRHRTRNLLSVVQALITNTLKESKTVTEAGHILSGRIRSLSNAYSLLAEGEWQGASLAKILSLQSILDSERVTISGCDVVVTPRAAQQFAMIVHELATNALKYGALSSPNGRISISGKLDRHDSSGTFVFSWKEGGGPRVSPSTRRGFGSVILLEAAQQFGSVTMDYLPEGLVYQLKLDLSTIETPENVIMFPKMPTHIQSGSDVA
jgi:PAS domain S-box-containing protein